MASRSAPIAHINRIATAVPRHEVHRKFLDFAESRLKPREVTLFRRMAQRSGIAHRYSCLGPADDPDTVQPEAFYRLGAFPSTAERMAVFERQAPRLAETAVERLALGPARKRISHLIVATCTGFSAPGLDLELTERFGLNPSVERTIVGFMGCYAAINALKLARHIVRSESDARVLVVNLELCTLHLKEHGNLEQILSFMLFADGCSAALVTSEPQGIALDRFHAAFVPDTSELITWNIRDFGFDMVLSGEVPGAIQHAPGDCASEILHGTPASAIDLWAIHPGGRTVLDAVEQAFQLPAEKLAVSREVLRRYGNMSSATVMFVLEAMMRQVQAGQRGCAMGFGPGMVAETMLFHAVSAMADASRRDGVIKIARRAKRIPEQVEG
jgi:predicted naringenin-chalcone synthase